MSKASGIEWLAGRHGLGAEAVLVIGNDYNDLEMLEWARQAQVVANAPAPLYRRFETVPNNDQDGFSIRKPISSRADPGSGADFHCRY